MLNSYIVLVDTTLNNACLFQLSKRKAAEQQIIRRNHINSLEYLFPKGPIIRRVLVSVLGPFLQKYFWYQCELHLS